MNIPFWESGADLSLAARIKRAAFAMTMLLVATLGSVLLTLAVIEIPANQTKANQHAVNVIGEVLSVDIRNQLGNLRQLSRSPLVWTALTDSAGREAYLKPFLQSREKDAYVVPMQLLDYRGRRVLGDLPASVATGRLAQLVTRVLKQQQPVLAVVANDGRPALLAIFPVPFPYTQETIGALAGVINLSELLQRRSTGLGEDLGVNLVHQGRAIAVRPGAVSSNYFPANFDLGLGESIEGGALTLRLYATENPWLRPVFERILLSLLLAALLGILLWQISGVIARQLTRRFDRLADACVAISEGRAATIPEDAANDEIGVLSRTLRQAVDAYEQINFRLEKLVEERTRELAQSELKFRLLSEKSVVGIYVIQDARMAYVNPSLARTFGYSADEIVGKLSFEDLIHPDDIQLVRTRFKERLQGKIERSNAVYKGVKKDGTPIYIETYGVLLDYQGAPAVMGSLQDITERKRAEEALAGSEKKFRDLVETASDWVWEIDEKGAYTYCSPRVRDLLGYEPQELIGKSPFDLMPAAEAARVGAIFGALVAARKPLLALENLSLRKDGREAVLETSGVPVFDAQGAFRGYRGIDRDITQRRHAEREALEQFKLAEAFFNNSVSGLVILDRNFNFVRVNAAYAKSARKEVGDFTGRNHFEMYPSDARPIFEEVVRSKRPFTTFTRAFAYPDQPERGTTYWDWTLAPILDQQGEVEYLVFSLQEVTERKRVEEEQRAAAFYARSLIEASPDPLVTISAQGKITDVNKATEDATGVARDLLIGADFADYFTDPDKARAGYQEVLARGSVRDYPLTIRHRAGHTIDVLYNATVYRNEAGELQGVFAAARDITERKRAQEALQRSEAGLKEAQRIAHVGNWELDLVGNMLTWTDEIYRIFEIDPKQFGASYEAFLDAIHPDDREFVDRTYTESVKSKTPYDIVHRLLMRDGRVKYVNERCETAYDRSDRPLHSIGTVQDITERKQAENALREREEFLNSVVDNIPDMIFVKEAEALRFVRFNKAGEQLLGYAREDLLGKNDYDLFPKEEADFFVAKDCEVLANKRLVDIPEEKIRTRDKDERLLHTKKIPILDHEGKPQYLLGISEDITERRRVEQKLLESEQRLRLHVEQTPLAVIEWDTDFRVVHWNPAAERIFGYTAAEAGGRHASFIVAGEAKAAVDAVWRSLLSGRGGERSTNENVTKNGRAILCEWYNTPLIMSGGKVIGVASLVEDVTVRKQAELVRTQLAAIVQSSHDAIIGKDLDGVITSWNPGAEKVYGYRAEEVIGKPVSILAPEDRRDEIAGLLERARRGEAVMNFETERYRKDGRRIDISLDMSPIRDAGARITGASTIARDVTEKKRAERALKKLNRALKALSSCNEALIHATDERQLLDRICRLIIDIEGYRMAWVGYVEHDGNKTVRPVAQAGYEAGYLEHADITWADNERGGPLGLAIRSGRIQVVQDVNIDPGAESWRAGAAGLGYRSVFVAPLLSGSAVIGALSIYADSADAFDQAEIALLGELAADMAFGVVTLRTRGAQEQSSARLQLSMEATIQAIAGTVEMRDPYTAGHQRRVAELATAIAQELGLTQDQVRGVHLAGVVHDLGKIHIPAEILSKPGKLTRIEFELIKAHPEAGYEILKGVDFPWPIAQIVFQHHERLDGSGYPRGLKADEILLEARIIAVADVVEAMSSHRPYRPSLGLEPALQEISANAGKYYDADAARVCVALFREQGFAFKG